MVIIVKKEKMMEMKFISILYSIKKNSDDYKNNNNDSDYIEKNVADQQEMECRRYGKLVSAQRNHANSKEG